MIMSDRYIPLLEVSDTLTPELSGIRQGNRVDMILNYKVIEITKSYTILQIDYVSRINTTRAT